MAANELSLLNDPNITYSLTGSETIRRHYQSLIRNYEALKEENETIRKRYSDLVESHTDYGNKLEMAHQDFFRLRKNYEECLQIKKVLTQEVQQYKHQCTTAINNWHKIQSDNNELKEELIKVKAQRDDTMTQSNQLMALRAKITRDMAKLTEERNEAVQDLQLIMSERDSVHKEIEKLQEEQQILQKHNKQLENEKKQLAEETESLKREITSALFDRDRVLKVCNDLREKYGDYVTGINDESMSPTSPQPRSGHNFWGSSSSGVSTSWAHMMSKSSNIVLSAASSNSSVSTFSHPHNPHNPHNKLCSNSRLDNIDQANTEIETLRKQMERIQTDLGEAHQEVEVCKRRRDWAFSERDKIVLERESIRTLCDKLRRERDRAVSDLAEALRESDDIKRQRNEITKENKELKEKIDGMKGDSRAKSQTQSTQLGTNNSSRDSAIEADLQEYEIETKEIQLKREHKSNEWGFKLVFDDKTLLIDKVIKDSASDGKLKVNDVLIKVNDTNTNNDEKIAYELLKKSDLQIVLTVQRKRVTRFVQTVNMSVGKGQEHGLVLEQGYYVSRITVGSVAAKEGSIAVGDRILSINDKTIDDKSSYDVLQLLESSPNIVLQIMKNNSHVCSQSNSSSSIVNNSSKSSSESTDSKSYNIRERQRKMVSCCSQTDNYISFPTTKPPMPSDYQTLSRTIGERNSANISTTNKTIISSFSNSSNSSSPANEVQSPITPAPTLLDKADRIYNKSIGKFFGERKQNTKPKQSQVFCEDETRTLAELDKVLDKYSNGKTYEKNTKYIKSGKTSKKEKNGGTWPKYRGHPPVPSIQNYTNVNAVTTLHPIKRKERKSLGIFTNTFIKSEKSDKTASGLTQNIPKPEEEKSSNNSIKDERMTPSSYLIFEPASEAALIDYERNSKRNSALSSRLSTLQSVPLTSNANQKAIYASNTQPYNGNKTDTLDLKLYRPIKPMTNTSLDYSVVSAQTKDKNVLDYYTKHRTNSRQMRPHSVHDVLMDVTQPSLSLTEDHSSYDSFHASSASTPPLNAAPTPPIRNSAAFPYYGLNSQSALLQIHNNHFGQNSHLIRNSNQPSVRHSTNSPLISPYISRSGDSLLSANESQTHSHDLSHSRSVSAYQGGVRPYNLKDNLVNRYSITPSPSPSQYSSGMFGGPSPSHSMDIMATTASGTHFHNINQTKRMVTPQPIHQKHLHHLSTNSNNNVFRSDDNNLSIPSFDGLSTFPKRNNQRFRIPSNPSVTSKSSGGKLSTSSIDKASSSVLSDRGSPMPCAYHVEWITPSRNSNSDGERVAKPGDVRNIFIERSSAPSMGINIKPCTSGGVFVCHVAENSLAAQAGVLIGDQLMEICGINMRKATYDLAANVLRQCGNNIRILVQYNPDKFDNEDDNESDGADADEDDDMVDADEDDTGANDSTSTSTPQSSPIEYKSLLVRANTNNTNNDENIPSSATSTLTRSKAASRSASNASRNTEKTLTDYSIRERQSSFKQSSTGCEPRRIIIKKTNSNLGISLFGGNAVGIFIHSVRDDSLANGPNGLKPGDQILEYNGVDLRNATAEEAAIELAKPAETVTLVAQYNVERFKEIQDQHTGDSFYIRAAFDRPSVDGSLAFRKDDILFVDNTMFNGVPGLWRAWLVDQEGQKVKCGVIPSKYKVEEELLMKRSLTDSAGDGNSRAATSARRSFFRRRKNNHQRSSSRESTKELASFSDVSINSFSDSGAITAETDYNCQFLPLTYIRVERLSYKTTRPVIIIGPLQEVLSIKLEQDFQQTFKRCVPEIMKGSQQMMERWLQDLKLVDYRRDYRGSQGSHFECITVAAVKEICDKNLHALLEVSPISVERLNRCQIYPVVVFLKFKSTKQIKEIKDHRYPNEKLTTKAAKEMYEHSLKIESEYKHLINVVIPGSNLSYMCTQVKTSIEEEQNKALWV